MVDPKDPDKPDQPFEPDDPDVPGIDTWNFMTSRNIDFGEHDLSQNLIEQKYASWMEARGVNEEYVGIVIKNGTTDKLQITVEVGNFTLKDEAVKTTTLDGYILDLVKDDFIPKLADADGKNGNITNQKIDDITKPEKAKADSTNSKFDKATDHKPATLQSGLKATILTTPGIGIHAASWGGVLTVPQNSVVKIGEAQAIMEWNILRAPTP